LGEEAAAVEDEEERTIRAPKEKTTIKERLDRWKSGDDDDALPSRFIMISIVLYGGGGGGNTSKEGFDSGIDNKLQGKQTRQPEPVLLVALRRKGRGRRSWIDVVMCLVISSGNKWQRHLSSSSSSTMPCFIKMIIITQTGAWDYHSGDKLNHKRPQQPLHLLPKWRLLLLPPLPPCT